MTAAEEHEMAEARHAFMEQHFYDPRIKFMVWGHELGLELHVMRNDEDMPQELKIRFWEDVLDVVEEALAEVIADGEGSADSAQ